MLFFFNICGNIYQSTLEEAQKGKAAVSEKFAVLDAEYRTYKQCCNSPNNIAEQLQELLNLEAVKASAQSRVAAAEVDIGPVLSLTLFMKADKDNRRMPKLTGY